MIASEVHSIVQRSKQLYESRRIELEEHHKGSFVAIEPDSGSMFVGVSFDDAVTQARKAYPDRVSHTIRIGYRAAFHVGLMTQ